MQIYDISQSLHEGMAVWPGDQKFRSRRTMRIAAGDPCNVSALTMSSHAGTHLDAPLHFDDGGADIAGLALKHYLGPARVVEISASHYIAAADLERLELTGVERILFKTHASSVQENQIYRNFVFLTENGAEWLGRRQMLLVGTDAPSIDSADSRTLGVHKILFALGVAILEGVRLAHVPAGDYELICLPLKLEGMDGSPVRAVLRR